MGPHAMHSCKDCLRGRIMSGLPASSGRSPSGLLHNGGADGPDAPNGEVPCECGKLTR